MRPSAGRPAPVSASAYDSMYVRATEDAAAHAPWHTVAAPYGVDVSDGDAAPGRPGDARRVKGMTQEEKDVLAAKVAAKVSPAAYMRRRVVDGSFKGLGVDVPEPVVSTGRGTRVKGTTPDELHVFEARVDEALSEHARATPSKSSKRRVCSLPPLPPPPALHARGCARPHSPLVL